MGLEIMVAGRTKRARVLSLGEAWERTTSKDVVRELDLEEGVNLQEALLDDAINEIESDLAKRRAFDILSRKACCEAELKSKLFDDGYPSHVVHKTLERLSELGYINDIAYVRSFIEVKHAVGWGKQKILNTLVQKQVSQNTIEDALAEYDFEGFDADDQIERAFLLIEKRPCETRRDKEKLLRKLISRGFSYDHANQAIRRRQAEVS